MMRIITGSARGTRLLAPEGLNTRPTSERANMGIFNILQFQISGRRVLDLFAGSGQMALEALSRGAEYAYICDSAKDAVDIIKKNVQKTRLTDCSVLCADYKQAIKQLSNESFDLIILDPPYKLGLIPDAVSRLANADMIKAGGIVVCEDEREAPYEFEGFTLRRHAKYGRAYLTVLEKNILKKDLEEH